MYVPARLTRLACARFARDVSHNDLSRLPKGLANKMVHDPEYTINLEGNYELVYVKNNISTECLLTDTVGFAQQHRIVQVDGVEIRTDVCKMCSTDVIVIITTIFIVAWIVVGGSIIWKVAGADWRPDSRAGVSCVVYYGRCASAHTAASNWYNDISRHLDEDEGSIRLDHSGVGCGDEVILKNLRGKHMKFTTMHATVIKLSSDGSKAKVSVHGAHKFREFPVENMEPKMDLEVHDDTETPALCFCISQEWVEAESFVEDMLRILTQRIRIDEHTRDDIDLENAGLATGCVFVLFGVSADNQTILTLTEKLQITPDQIATSDANGGLDLDRKEQLLGQIEHFLEMESVDFLDNQEHFRSLVDARAEAQGALASALSNKSAQHAAKILGNQAKIVSAQLSQCFMALQLDLAWPNFLVSFGHWLGSFIVFDLEFFTVALCMRDEVVANTAVAVFLLVVFAVICVVVQHNQWRQGKCRKHTWNSGTADDNNAAAATAAHLTNTGWAAFTLLSPLVLSQCLFMAVNNGQHIPLIVLTVIIPGFALFKLLQARRGSRLHSRAFEASFGWLCARYRPVCFWWEIIYLENRFAVIIAEQMLDPVAAVCVGIVLTVVMLGLQHVNKPFMESEEEAEHWSSPNKMATLAYICQLIVMIAGLASDNSSADTVAGVALHVALSLIVMIALFLPLSLAAIMLRQVRQAALLELQDADDSSETINVVNRPARVYRSDESLRQRPQNRNTLVLQQPVLQDAQVLVGEEAPATAPAFEEERDSPMSMVQIRDTVSRSHT
jgi:hypothetical protein